MAPRPADTFKRNLPNYSAYSYGAAVKFKGAIGIDLSGKRSYSSDSWIIYEVAGNNKRLCGNNDWPDYAGKVMERFR